MQSEPRSEPISSQMPSGCNTCYATDKGTRILVFTLGSKLEEAESTFSRFWSESVEKDKLLQIE